MTTQERRRLDTALLALWAGHVDHDTLQGDLQALELDRIERIGGDVRQSFKRHTVRHGKGRA